MYLFSCQWVLKLHYLAPIKEFNASTMISDVEFALPEFLLRRSQRAGKQHDEIYISIIRERV